MIWNKGLTKKEHKGIARVSKAKSDWWKNNDTTETRKKIGLASKGRIKPMEKHPSWKGGRYKETRGGYILVRKKDALSIRSDGYILEHRYKMEKKLGRKLSRNEEIHHKNGIKDDNKLLNLELVIKKIHFGKIKCPHCGKQFKVK